MSTTIPPSREDDGFMSLSASRIVAPVLLFFVTFACGISPHVFYKRCRDPDQQRIGRTHDSKLLSFMACYGGGVLFATVFLHLIPDVHHSFDEQDHDVDHNETESDRDHHDHHDHNHFPYTELTVCLGFLSVYLVEEILHACLGHSSHANEDHGHSHSIRLVQCAKDDPPIDPNRTTNHEEETVTVHTEMIHSAHSTEPRNLTLPETLLVAALSFHSLFEGMSLGLQANSKKTWLMLLALSLHKLVIAVVLGLELTAAKFSNTALFVYIAVFSFMTPLGSFGASLMDFEYSQTKLVSVLNGMAAGTLLYVTFFEVLQKQKNSSLPGLVQFFAILTGFSTILIMTMFIDHKH